MNVGDLAADEAPADGRRDWRERLTSPELWRARQAASFDERG